MIAPEVPEHNGTFLKQILCYSIERIWTFVLDVKRIDPHDHSKNLRLER